MSKHDDDTDRPALEDLVDSELVATAHREQTRLDEAFAVTAAERVVADVRFAELDAEHRAARRRLAAAKGLLTKARKDGAAAKIAAARQRVDAADAECDRIGRATIAEMQAMMTGQQDNLDGLLEQMDRSWAANRAVTDALTERPGSIGGPAPR